MAAPTVAPANASATSLPLSPTAVAAPTVLLVVWPLCGFRHGSNRDSRNRIRFFEYAFESPESKGRLVVAVLVAEARRTIAVRPNKIDDGQICKDYPSVRKAQVVFHGRQEKKRARGCGRGCGRGRDRVSKRASKEATGRFFCNSNRAFRSCQYLLVFT